MDIERMMVGPHGWVRFSAPADRAELYLRFRQGDDGRWRIHEVYLDSTRPISPVGLRQIPYAQCEEWVNDEAVAEHLATEWELVDAVGDNMAVLASHLGVTFGEDQTWLGQAFAASASPNPPKRRRRAPKRGKMVREDADRYDRLTEAPDTFPISDEFLEKVARAYRAALARGDHPNVVVSQDAHVDRRTAERWVAKARTRGFLGPARKGAAG